MTWDIYLSRHQDMCRVPSGLQLSADSVVAMEARSNFDASEALVAELDTVLLHTPQEFQRGLGTVRAAVRFLPHAHAHDPIEHQGEETNPRVGTNVIRYAVEDWRDLKLALEHTKAPFDVGQALVSHPRCAPHRSP